MTSPTSGLLTLRRELLKKNPQALSRAHVGSGHFRAVSMPRAPNATGSSDPCRLQRTGGMFMSTRNLRTAARRLVHRPGAEKDPERSFSPGLRTRTAAGLEEDIVAEDSSLVIDTPARLLLITGCGHAGIVNIAETVEDAPSNVDDPRGDWRTWPVRRDRRSTDLDW